MQDHDFYRERRTFSKFEAWIDMLMEAQHNEEPQQITIGMKVLVCNYGESLKSNVTWSKRWNWTESKVRRFLKLLKNMKQIDYKSEGITTRITIINYATYDPKRLPNDEDATRTRRGRDEDATTDKNVKNVNNVNNTKPYKFILSDKTIYKPKKDYLDNLARLYPNINMDLTFAEIEAWCLSNPKKRKTRSGATKFINSWFSRANKNIQMETKEREINHNPAYKIRDESDIHELYE